MEESGNRFLLSRGGNMLQWSAKRPVFSNVSSPRLEIPQPNPKWIPVPPKLSKVQFNYVVNTWHNLNVVQLELHFVHEHYKLICSLWQGAHVLSKHAPVDTVLPPHLANANVDSNARKKSSYRAWFERGGQFRKLLALIRFRAQKFLCFTNSEISNSLNLLKSAACPGARTGR